MSGRLDQISDSDLVLIIGGGDKSAPAYHTAKFLRKPCLPIPGFGGASEEVWKPFRDDIGKLLLPLQDMRNQIEPWRDGSAAALLTFADEYVKSRPYSVRDRSYIALVSTVTVCAVLGWAVLFFGPQARGGFALFGLLIASSLMGVGLRLLGELMARADTQASSRLFWVRAVVAIVEGVALFLFLLVGAISITGEGEFLASLTNGADLARLSVIASLLALGAGLMTEEATEWLVAQYRKHFSNSLA